MIVLDLNVYSIPDSALLLRSMGINITAILLCALQFGYIFFNINIIYLN